MKYYFILFSALFLLAGIIAGCSGNIVDMKEKTAFPEGRLMYVSKCGGCHQYFKRDKFTAREWDSLLIPMKKKAHLNDEQRDKIFNYLTEKVNPDSNQPSL